MKWISVKERLPKDDDNVLVFLAPTDILIGSYFFRPMMRSFTWTMHDSDLDEYIEDITHWMPLPEPPKD